MEIIEMIMPIITIAILVFGMFWGFIRKFHKTLFRFVFLLLTMGASFFLAKMFSATVSEHVFNLLKSEQIKGVSELLENEAATDLVAALCRMLATPFLFLLFYVVLKPISWIPYKICTILFGIKGPKLFGRLSGAVAGVLCGLVGLVVFVTPVFGYMTMVEDTVKRLMPAEEIPEELEIVMNITDTPVAKQAYDLAGARFFTGLTTTTFDGGELSLEREVEAVVAAVEDGKGLLEKSPEQYGPEEGAAAKALAHDVGESHILSSLLSSVLAETANAWLNGEEAFGMAKPEMGADMQDIMDAFFAVFATSNSANIEMDLTTFADVFGIFIDNDMLAMLSDSGDTAAFVEKLVSDGVVSQLYAVLEANPRMAPVKAAIIDTGMRVVLEQLGVSEDLLEDHGELMEDVVGIAKDAVKEDGTLDAGALTESVQSTMEKYDVEVSPEVAQIVADGIAETFTAEELETLTVPELVDKLIGRFGEAELPENWQSMLPNS